MMKKLIAILLSICLLFALAACGAKKDDAPKAGEASFTVIVVHSDGTEKTFTYTTTEEYLGTVLEAEGLISGNDGPYGLEITHVDGEKAIYTEDQAYWALYEGDEYALQGISTTPVVDGGVYKLVYEAA